VELAWPRRNPTVGPCYHRTQQREVRASRMHVEREMLNKSVLEREHLSFVFEQAHTSSSHNRPVGIYACHSRIEVAIFESTLAVISTQFLTNAVALFSSHFNAVTICSCLVRRWVSSAAGCWF
jgi:hypothetical protein